MLPAICALLLATAIGQPAGPPVDLTGRARDPLAADPHTRVTVLVFVRTDCPLANQGAPEVERVRRTYEPEGVRMWLVYLDRAQASDEVARHRREYGLNATAILDAGHELVRRSGVHVTPEAAVYVHHGAEPRLVYRGPIDDRVVALGKQKPRPTTFYLRDAVAAALADQTLPLVARPAVGCEIADLR